MARSKKLFSNQIESKIYNRWDLFLLSLLLGALIQCCKSVLVKIPSLLNLIFVLCSKQNEPHSNCYKYQLG